MSARKSVPALPSLVCPEVFVDRQKRRLEVFLPPVEAAALPPQSSLKAAALERGRLSLAGEQQRDGRLLLTDEERGVVVLDRTLHAGRFMYNSDFEDMLIILSAREAQGQEVVLEPNTAAEEDHKCQTGCGFHGAEGEFGRLCSRCAKLSPEERSAETERNAARKREMWQLTLGFQDWREKDRLVDFLSGHAEDLAEIVSVSYSTSGDETDIGTYGQHDKCAGTELLRAGDVAAATRADVEEIYRSLNADSKAKSRGPPASEGGSFAAFPDISLLTEPVRKQLMDRLDEQHTRTRERDTKLVITLAELEAVVGTEALAALQQRFGAPIGCVKLRRVSAAEPGSSPPDVINFHLDVASKTLGIPLNDESEYSGSRLTYAVASTGSLVQPNRRAGSCTIHDNGIAHGVTPLLKGVRYGLFLLSS